MSLNEFVRESLELAQGEVEFATRIFEDVGKVLGPLSASIDEFIAVGEEIRHRIEAEEVDPEDLLAVFERFEVAIEDGLRAARIKYRGWTNVDAVGFFSWEKLKNRREEILSRIGGGA